MNEMTSLAITLVIYYGVAILLYLGIKTGRFDFKVTHKSDGSELNRDTFLYEFIAFVYCFGWLFPALQLIKRRLFDGQDN